MTTPDAIRAGNLRGEAARLGAEAHHFEQSALRLVTYSANAAYHLNGASRALYLAASRLEAEAAALTPPPEELP